MPLKSIGTTGIRHASTQYRYYTQWRRRPVCRRNCWLAHNRQHRQITAYYWYLCPSGLRRPHRTFYRCRTAVIVSFDTQDTTKLRAMNLKKPVFQKKQGSSRETTCPAGRVRRFPQSCGGESGRVMRYSKYDGWGRVRSISNITGLVG